MLDFFSRNRSKYTTAFMTLFFRRREPEGSMQRLIPRTGSGNQQESLGLHRWGWLIGGDVDVLGTQEQKHCMNIADGST